MTHARLKVKHQLADFNEVLTRFMLKRAPSALQAIELFLVPRISQVTSTSSSWTRPASRPSNNFSVISVSNILQFDHLIDHSIESVNEKWFCVFVFWESWVLANRKFGGAGRVLPLRATWRSVPPVCRVCVPYTRVLCGKQGHRGLPHLSSKPNFDFDRFAATWLSKREEVHDRIQAPGRSG